MKTPEYYEEVEAFLRMTSRDRDAHAGRLYFCGTNAPLSYQGNANTYLLIIDDIFICFKVVVAGCCRRKSILNSLK